MDRKYTPLIASLIIYKWIVKHLLTLYQGNPGDQSDTGEGYGAIFKSRT